MAGQFLGTPQEQAYTAGLDVNRRLVAAVDEVPEHLEVRARPDLRAVAGVRRDPARGVRREGAGRHRTALRERRPGQADPPARRRGVPRQVARRACARWPTVTVSSSRRTARSRRYGEPDKEALRLVLHGLASPLYAKADQRRRFLKRDVQTQHNALKRKVDELKANDPGAPPMAMVLIDKPTPRTRRSSSAATPARPARSCRGGSSQCVSTGERKPFTRRQRPARAGEGDRAARTTRSPRA